MRTKKAFFSILSSLFVQLIVAISGFILPRLYITTYGSSINGLVTSVKQIMIYFSIVGGGIGAAAIAQLYEPIQHEDTVTINKILSAAKKFFKRTSYVFILLIVGLAMIYPLITRNQISMMLAFKIIIILGAGSMCEYFVFSKYRTILMADQKSYIVSWIQAQGIILNTIAAVVLIYFKSSIVIVQLFSTIIYILRMFWASTYVKKHYPYVNYCMDADENIIKGRWDALLYQLTIMIVTYTPVVVITVFCGLKEVSVFSVYNMMFSSINMIIGIFSFGFTAAFGSIIATGDMEALRKNFAVFEYMYYIIAFIGYTCATILILPFISVYTRGVTDVRYVRPIVAFAFITSGLTYNLRIPHEVLIEASGHFRQNRNYNIAEACICIFLSIIFVSFFGIQGVIFAVAVAGLYRTVVYVLYAARKVLKRNLKHTIRAICVNFLLAAIAAEPFILTHIEVSNLLDWFSWAFMVLLWSTTVFVGGNVLSDFASASEMYIKVRNLIYSFKSGK